MSWDRAIGLVNGLLGTLAPGGIRSLDPLDRLPDAARLKLLAMRDEAADLHSSTLRLEGELNDLRRSRGEIERRLRHLVDPRASGGYQLGDDDPRVVTERQAIERIEAELRRISTLYDGRNARWQELRRLVSALEKWTDRLPVDAVLVPYEPAPIALRKSETLSDAVERVRGQIAGLQADLHRVRSAPITSSMAKAKARAEIETLAGWGAPDCFGLIEHGEAVQWPRARADVQTFGGDPSRPTVTVSTADSLAVLAWLHRDALIAAIEAEIDTRADDGAALDDNARARRAAELQDAILATERTEEALIEQARSTGVVIVRRADADPRAVLGVELSGTSS